jgi:hypothetical protein
MYGCINEDEFTFNSPRLIDGDEVATITEAMEQARNMLEEGTEQVAICRCKYYGEDGNGYWGEIVGDGQIILDASNVEWIKDEEEV